MTDLRCILPGVAFLVFALATPAVAEEKGVVVPADEVQWTSGPATLPDGAQLAVLSGHPAEEGPFVIRLKFPENYRVPAHWHSKSEHLTVIDGTFRFGHGDELNKGASHTLPVGSFVRIPAGMRHFAWTDEGAVVQIHGDGPFDIHYVNPKDDPRRQASN